MLYNNLNGNSEQQIENDFLTVIDKARELHEAIRKAESLYNARNAKDATHANFLRETRQANAAKAQEIEDFYMNALIAFQELKYIHE